MSGEYMERQEGRDGAAIARYRAAAISRSNGNIRENVRRERDERVGHESVDQSNGWVVDAAAARKYVHRWVT